MAKAKAQTELTSVVAATLEPTPGQRAFDAYNNERGGLTHDGKPIPGWSEVGDGIRAAWEAAALAVEAPWERRLAEYERAAAERAREAAEAAEAATAREIERRLAEYEQAALERAREAAEAAEAATAREVARAIAHVTSPPAIAWQRVRRLERELEEARAAARGGGA